MRRKTRDKFKYKKKQEDVRRDEREQLSINVIVNLCYEHTCSAQPNKSCKMAAMDASSPSATASERRVCEGEEGEAHREI